MKRTRIPRRSPNYARRHKVNMANKEERNKHRVKKRLYPRPDKNEAVTRFRDGREICNDRFEYDRRRNAMAERQGWICPYCGEYMIGTQGHPRSVTFEHVDGRKMGGAIRDDRIEIDGKPYNLAVCWTCNMKAGSPKRKKKLARVSDVCIIDGYEEVSNISSRTDVEAARKDAS